MNWIVVVATLGVFALVMIGMAVGVIMGRRAISGSCGGLANRRDESGEVQCSLCQNPDEACRELKRRMHEQSGATSDQRE
ncbi:MAG: (Na+)-NQR maturation NqrM [Planctomycetota bacterium]|nr:MAG: (Na+)-NQR maturation NqrM [Planctomycetota bacterium]